MKHTYNTHSAPSINVEVETEDLYTFEVPVLINMNGTDLEPEVRPDFKLSEETMNVLFKNKPTYITINANGFTFVITGRNGHIELTNFCEGTVHDHLNDSGFFEEPDNADEQYRKLKFGEW